MKIKLVDMPEIPKSILIPSVLYDNLDKLDYVEGDTCISSFINNKPFLIHFNHRLGYSMRPSYSDLYVPNDIMEWYDKESDTIIMPNIFKRIDINNYNVIIHPKLCDLPDYSPYGYICDYYFNNKEIGFVNYDGSIDMIIIPDCKMIRIARTGEQCIDYRYKSQNNIIDQFIKGEHTFELTINIKEV